MRCIHLPGEVCFPSFFVFWTDDQKTTMGTHTSHPTGGPPTEVPRPAESSAPMCFSRAAAADPPFLLNEPSGEDGSLQWIDSLTAPTKNCSKKKTYTQRRLKTQLNSTCNTTGSCETAKKSQPLLLSETALDLEVLPHRALHLLQSWHIFITSLIGDIETQHRPQPLQHRNVNLRAPEMGFNYLYASLHQLKTTIIFHWSACIVLEISWDKRTVQPKGCQPKNSHLDTWDSECQAPAAHVGHAAFPNPAAHKRAEFFGGAENIHHQKKGNFIFKPSIQQVLKC